MFNNLSFQKDELTKKARENKEVIERQQNLIEEMERKIKILEADLEAAENDCDESKKYIASYTIRVLGRG